MSDERAFARTCGNAVDVVLDRGPTRAARRPAELEVTPLVDAEQLVGVAVLLVVVDQARIRRRGDDAVVRAFEIDRAGVAVQHPRDAAVGPDGRERLDPLQRVERVAQQEPAGRLDRLALAPVLEAPVGLELRLARELEVEVGGAPGRAGRAGEHDAQHVGRADLLDERPEVQQLLCGRGREPGAHVGRCAARIASARLEGLRLGVRPEQVATQRLEVVRARLDAGQQRVEAGDVDTGGVVPGLERLHERRARACERVEHAAAGGNVPVEQRLDELRDELAEVRVQAMDVLRPLALRQRRLRPGQLEIVRLVERFLGGRHARIRHRAVARPPRPLGRSHAVRASVDAARGRQAPARER